MYRFGLFNAPPFLGYESPIAYPTVLEASAIELLTFENISDVLLKTYFAWVSSLDVLFV